MAAAVPDYEECDAPPSVLIVDDSVVARAVMARAIDGAGRFIVAGAVSDAHAAQAFLAKHRVDVIVLDIEMPGIDGLTALPDLIAASRGARVLIVSSACADGAATTIQALALGAADTLVKPEVGAFAGRFAGLLNEKIDRLVQVDEVVAPRTPAAATVPGDDFDIVAIGASTGGIHALSSLLRSLPAEFRLPVLITQHLPESFMPYFAAQVAVLAGRPCEVAEDHARIRPGRILIAPGRAHLRCVSMGDGAAVRLSTASSASGCLPSVDPMLESVAETFGDRALGVVLSGMGRDGVIGAAALAEAGGSLVVQDRASSVVWGMPGAVVTAGIADAILPPDEIGQLIARRRRPDRGRASC
ncbi:MAG: chemotaxis-specific protein-glutamate methyltransferase CheB [Sphingomonas sp.]|uniref:chemotaxis-specific protein-glutamate methyltransferase CheB n=1 Tax=Sphingomonas sp. TaxID=28214 RepID=UPI00121D3872|nr:chemotaxis-specific protein-glutamate methyltransferase CheB [Sphingomonas sp.]THD36829.1 MAG: chemotaxis-specific protein-glutamate methyltransferase CheB [Sphingomonas sp.]